MLVLQLVELFCEALEPSGSVLLGVGLWKGPGSGPGFGLSLSACWSAVLGEASMAWPRWLCQCRKALWSSLKALWSSLKALWSCEPKWLFSPGLLILPQWCRERFKSFKISTTRKSTAKSPGRSRTVQHSVSLTSWIFFFMVICYFHSFFRGQLR